ncbi:MAG: pseudaminic acid biosynthesis-associated methylase [Pseudomonadota bacterium]
MPEKAYSEVSRLEGLWGGEFGNAYVDRNIDARNGREPFWKNLIARYEIQNVLEVGCNVGANLFWLNQLLESRRVFGIDINEKALKELKKRNPEVNAVWSPAKELPFRDRHFDLVFTTGVLIHQTPLSLPLVMSEIVRCSRKFILCAEYFAEDLTEIPYRNQHGALFKQNYGKIYQDLFPYLELMDQGFLPKEEGGWDDVTYWLFRKPG